MTIRKINLKRLNTIKAYLLMIPHLKDKDMIDRHYQYIHNLIELIDTDKKGTFVTVD